jgi:hypothetical protein
MASAKGALIMVVEIAARKVRNTVISVQRAKNDGPAHTHNTGECRTYNPDGSRKYKGKSNGDKKTQKNFSQMLKTQQEKIENLESKVVNAHG